MISKAFLFAITLLQSESSSSFPYYMEDFSGGKTINFPQSYTKSMKNGKTFIGESFVHCEQERKKEREFLLKFKLAF
jgi:hypothetical protein